MGTRPGLVEQALRLGMMATALLVIALTPGAVQANTITEIIDSTGDGAGNPLVFERDSGGQW